MRINKGYDISGFEELEMKISDLISKKKKLMKEMLKNTENDLEHIDKLNEINTEIEKTKN